jgi:hypothetical protein
MAIWYILLVFGIFSPFWYVVERKIWQSWPGRGRLGGVSSMSRTSLDCLSKAKAKKNNPVFCTNPSLFDVQIRFGETGGTKKGDKQEPSSVECYAISNVWLQLFSFKKKKALMPVCVMQCQHMHIYRQCQSVSSLRPLKY